LGDLVELETDRQPDRYRTLTLAAVQHSDETNRGRWRGRAARADTWTIWGPVLGRTTAAAAPRYAWVAHSAERLATTVTPLESARTIEDAFDEVNGVGIPGQNLVIADRSGRIGWTVYGAIPAAPASTACSHLRGPMDRTVEGWLERREYPRILDPPAAASGRQMRASLAATCSRSWATAATRLGRARGKSASG